MPFGRLVLALLTLILAFAPLRAEATAWDQPFAASAQDLLSATQGLPSEPGDGVVMLLEEQRWSLDEEARCEMVHRRIFRILDADGVRDWGSVGAGWEPWRQARPVIRARVIRPDGSVRELDASTIDEAPARDDLPDILTSARVLRAPFPNLAPGCVVEQEIVTRDEAPLLKRVFSGTCWLGLRVPIAGSRFVVEAPVALPLRTFARGIPVAPEREERDGRVRMTWNWQAVPRDDVRLRLPPLAVASGPHVSVTTAASWGEVATAYAAIIDERARPDDLVARARAVAGDAADARSAAVRCLAEVHEHVRYTGLEFGEAAIVPVPPATCLERGYGDCKDKATLLVAMLRALGHRADVALLMPGRPLEIDEEVPGLADFTHAIVAVGEPPLFIDATAPEAAVGELPDMDRGHLALVARPGVEGLVRLPETSPDVDRVVETVEVVLAEEGRASLVETTQSWGSFAVADRAARVGITPDDLARNLTPYAKQVYGASAVAEAEASAASNLAAPTSLRFRAEEPTRTFAEWPSAGVGMTYGSWVQDLYGILDDGDAKPSTIPPTPHATRRRLAEETRTLPLVLPRAFSWERTYHVVPPPGHEMVGPPEIQPWTSGPATFSTETKARDDGSVDVVMRFSTGDGLFTREQAKQLADRLKEMHESKRPLVIYRAIASRLLDADDVRGGLAELRRLAALHPTEALHHVHLATSLLEVGLGEAARREAALAVKLEPASALAWRTRGYVLQRDVLGRPQAEDADFEGALAALREAKRLDPKDPEARRELADLLGREHGLVSWEPAKARAEAEEWRAMKQDLGDEAGEVDGPLAAALYRADDLEAIIALGDAAKGARSEQLDDHALAAIAVREGVASAIHRASTPPFDARNRSNLLAGVASTLLMGRHYPEAAVALAEAARGSDRATELGARVDAMKRARRFDSALLPEDDPRSVVQRFLVEVTTGEIASAQELMDPTARRVDPSLQRLELVAPSLRAGFPRSGLSPAAASDCIASGGEYTAESDGADGARVRMRARAASYDYFVRRTQGGWRIVAMDTGPPLLGRVALEHAAAGRVEQARRWLDWARQAWTRDIPGKPAFASIWTEGQQADAARCRLAAAILAAPVDDDGSARAELMADREGADPETRRRIDEAIALSLIAAKDFEGAVVAARPLAESEIGAGTATLALGRALDELHRPAEIVAFLEGRADAGDRPSASRERLLARNLAESGRVAEALTVLRALDARGDARPSDHNSIAWYGLIAEEPPEALVGDAQAAASGDPPSRAGLHTLAAVLVELGRLREARQTMLRRFEVDGDGEPEPDDWYVLGRLAEEYGEIDAARAAFERTVKDDEHAGDPTATRVLAQRRLDKLAAPAAPASVATPPG
jgi:tetratricopeptide (TPR) repeat protein